MAKESRFHKRTKNIKRCFNSIYDQVKEGDIEICKIHTDVNVGDKRWDAFWSIPKLSCLDLP